MSVEAILSQVEELTLEQRAELLQRLETDLIEAGWQPEFDLTDDVKALLDQRIAASDANPGAGIPWEVVKAESLKRART